MEKREKSGGRQKGTTNKLTHMGRLAIINLIEDNSSKIQGWIEEVYRDDGAQAAIDCYLKFAEFAIPKLARTEIQTLNADGEKTEGFKIIIEHVSANAQS